MSTAVGADTWKLTQRSPHLPSSGDANSEGGGVADNTTGVVREIGLLYGEIPSNFIEHK